ncbi:hypothetical protein TERTU_3640 [Teredinibacter turnerae T7901]|uniref:Uncharacterized protein n=1 Tax=Teredinibacter turnerae (strain ATCC 39867 / T7901) TaxID=377629 RepID=C5BS32_TERTT|nr:hypothetical protein TERTU_3640 [Teredinibacter turnerae T7901]
MLARLSYLVCYWLLLQASGFRFTVKNNCDVWGDTETVYYFKMVD